MPESKKMVASSPKSAGVRVGLQKLQDSYMDSLTRQVAAMNIDLDAEQKSCGMALLSAVQAAMNDNNLTIQQVDQTTLVRALQMACLLRLNANAVPRECYVIMRGNKVDFGIEGDGNDKLLRNYGVDVKKVHPYWLVREHDEFTYPSYDGLKIVPPTWKPKDMTSKVVRVVYPIEMNDGEMLWKISERDDVKKSLLGNINQNMMKDNNKKGNRKQLIDRLGNLTLDQIFEDKEALTNMSPSWSSPHSRESMIIRKMRNACTKPIQKDFGNAFIQRAYEDADDGRMDVTDVVDAEVTEKAGSNPLETPQIDAVTGEVSETLTEAKEVAQTAGNEAKTRSQQQTAEDPF